MMPVADGSLGHPCEEQADQKVSTSAGDLAVTASFGVASSVPPAFRTPQALVGAADMALYLSKADGRNRTTLSRH